MSKARLDAKIEYPHLKRIDNHQLIEKLIIVVDQPEDKLEVSTLNRGEVASSSIITVDNHRESFSITYPRLFQLLKNNPIYLEKE